MNRTGETTVRSPKERPCTCGLCHLIPDATRSRAIPRRHSRRFRKAADGGFVEELVDIQKWFTHPDDKNIDVAIAEKGIPAKADHVVIPMGFGVTEEIFRKYEVGLGDEVFVSGLFGSYYGKKRNIPIVRVGHLAALGDEKILTNAFGEIDGYLIDARSTGGLSGSPVFLNLGGVRLIGGQVTAVTQDTIILLGLIHGHFLQPNSTDGTVDVSSADDALTEAINAGIAIVVAMKSIRAVIDAYEKQ